MTMNKVLLNPVFQSGVTRLSITSFLINNSFSVDEAHSAR